MRLGPTICQRQCGHAQVKSLSSQQGVPLIRSLLHSQLPVNLIQYVNMEGCVRCRLERTEKERSSAITQEIGRQVQGIY